MIRLCSPRNEVELALLKGILDGEGIPYVVQNDHFGSLKVGPRIELFNAKTIMVPEEHGELAKELILQYLGSVQEDSQAVDVEYTLLDKIRMIFEVLLFGWVMPGKRWRKRKGDKSAVDS